MNGVRRHGAQGGNKGYCVSVKLAAEKAKLPGVSNSKMYRDFQKAGFDMWGSLGTIMRGRFVPEADICCSYGLILIVVNFRHKTDLH